MQKGVPYACSCFSHIFPKFIITYNEFFSCNDIAFVHNSKRKLQNRFLLLVLLRQGSQVLLWTNLLSSHMKSLQKLLMTSAWIIRLGKAALDLFTMQNYKERFVESYIVVWLSYFRIWVLYTFKPRCNMSLIGLKTP